MKRTLSFFLFFSFERNVGQDDCNITSCVASANPVPSGDCPLSTYRTATVSFERQPGEFQRNFSNLKGKTYAVYVAGEWEDKGIVKASVFSSFFFKYEFFLISDSKIKMPERLQR